MLLLVSLLQALFLTSFAFSSHILINFGPGFCYKVCLTYLWPFSLIRVMSRSASFISFLLLLCRLLNLGKNDSKLLLMCLFFSIFLHCPCGRLIFLVLCSTILFLKLLLNLTELLPLLFSKLWSSNLLHEFHGLLSILSLLSS